MARKKLSELMGAMKKEMGDNIQQATEGSWADVRTTIPTGTTILDEMLSGGYPTKRMIEIFGPEGAGKSTLWMLAAVECQKMDGIVILLDSEASFDTKRAIELGLDLEEMIHILPEKLFINRGKASPDYLTKKQTEKALKDYSAGKGLPDDVEMIETLTVEYGFDMIHKQLSFLKSQYMGEDFPIMVVWDTIANSPTRAELLQTNSGGMMEKPRQLKAAFRKITGQMGSSDVAFFMINQIHKTPDKFKPVDSPGGSAIKHMASYRLYAYMKGQSEEGHTLVVKVKKSRLNAPARDINVWFDYQLGGRVNDIRSTIDFLVEVGIDEVRFAGSWYTLKLTDPDGEIVEIKSRKNDLLDKFKEYGWAKDALDDVLRKTLSKLK